MDDHCTNTDNDGDFLTFGELLLVALDRAPAEHYSHMARYEDIITQLPEADAPVTMFSDFLHTYGCIKTKLASYLGESEYRLLNDNEAYIINFVFNIYVEYFS